MSGPVKTVEQGVEGMLRLWRDSYVENAEYLSGLIPSTEEYHLAVVAELDAIIDAYVGDPSEIRVGDTVRVTDAYPGGELTGEEFVVTGIGGSPWISQSGTHYEFFVQGDKRHRGVWDVYIEKVSK